MLIPKGLPHPLHKAQDRGADYHWGLRLCHVAIKHCQRAWGLHYRHLARNCS